MLGLSVLTLVKNRTGHLLRQIEGLSRGITRPNELIIVNMGQDPLELPVLEFPVRLLEFPSRGLPLAQARNLAASLARFEKLLFLDVDCIPMQHLLTDVTVCLGGFDGLLCAEIRYLAAGEVCDDWQEELLLLKASRHPVRNFPETGMQPESDYGLFWSLAFAMRRAQFVALNGFDERFTGYGAEDTEFSFRARDGGLNLAFLGGTGAFHQHHEIFDPPLQHFDDIVRNAELFHHIRGTWPMTGWLDAFEAMGLISTKPGRIEILRKPSEREIVMARKNLLEVF
jgi:hypothetical protein